MTQLDVAQTKNESRKRTRCSLRSLIDCRREAARIYRLGLSGDMAVEDVRQLAAVIRIVGGLIVDGDLEQRVCALERLDVKEFRR